MKNITFSDLFVKHAIKQLGIKRESAVEAVKNPDNKEEVNFDDQYIAQFYLKDLKREKGLSLLVYGRKVSDDHLDFSAGYKIYPDLCPNISSKRPTEILFEIAQRFGTNITIGADTAKFFFHQTLFLNTKGETKGRLNFAHVHTQPKSNYIAEFMVRQDDPVDNIIKVQVAMAFSIDIDQYLRWVHAH